MNRLRVTALVALTAVFVGCAGCDNPNAAPSSAGGSHASAVPGSSPATSNTSGAPSSFPSIPTNAQPRLQTIKLWLGAEEMVTEVALTAVQMQTGMMFRTNMLQNEGMLFVFPYPHQASFWMMNTYVPLSAAYINPEGVILEIHKLEPLNTNSVVADSDQIQYVLETPQGWFERHNVRTGAVIRSEYGPLRSTFTQRRSPQ